MREKRLILILFSVALFLTALSCGKKGDPIPKGLPIPEDIKDLSGEIKDGVLFLSFTIPKSNKDGTEIKNLEGFRVYKGCNGCIGAFEMFRDIKIDSRHGFTIYGGRLYLFDDDLKKGQSYSYKVIPYTKAMVRGNESNVFTIKWEATPEAPSGLSVKEDDESVELQWKREEGVLYNIYRRDNDTYPLFPLNDRPLISPSYRDTGLINNKRYIYEIRAVKESHGILWEGVGAKIEATPKDKTPPGIPIDVKAEKRDKVVSLTWRQQTEKDLKGYHVYRIDGGIVKRLTGEPIKENKYIDDKIPDSRYISYYVTSVDINGNESEPSQERIIMLKD
ncbi:MAG: hypothetical protein N3D15_04885 [Syntrophorhabdaceae bacterium]|nr:hypothetical protein [Syntrophorhabdaceae bacterium]